MIETSAESLRALMGEELASVTFVRDYLQLDFDNLGSGYHVFTAFRLPEVRVAHTWYKPEMPGYRDMLCERIDHVVCKAIALPMEEIYIEFDDTSVISVSLRPGGRHGPEAASLKRILGIQSTTLAVW